jgi:hypothetical protein
MSRLQEIHEPTPGRRQAERTDREPERKDEPAPTDEDARGE